MSHAALEAEVQARAEHPRTPDARDFDLVFRHWPQAEAQAPGTVHLLGDHAGGSDGWLLAAALPLSAGIALRRNGGSHFRLHCANAARTVVFTLEERPDEDFASHVFGCLRLAREELRVAVPALDIHLACDVPAGFGLAPSTAVAVATLRALRRLLSLELDDRRIAQLAQQAELQDAGVRCGLADEMACSLVVPGGAVLLDTRNFAHRVLAMPAGAALLVMGLEPAPPTAFITAQRRSECEQAARALQLPALRDVEHLERIEGLDDPLRSRARHHFTENARVLKALDAGSARAFGALLDASHASLRDDDESTAPALEALVDAMRKQPGVLGTRLCSGRSGQVAVALCESGAELEIARAVPDAVPLDFGRVRRLVPAPS